MEHILEYEKLVSKIASKYSSYSSYEDLRQVGMIGLIKAVDKYDDSSGIKFSTYAYKWILGEILEYIRNDRNIKISKDLIKLNKEIEVCSEVLRQKLNKEPSTSEIAFFLEKEEADIIDALVAKEYIYSLDYNANNEDDSINLYDTVSYYEKGYDSDYLDLYNALKLLDEKERKIIEMHYFNDMTQSEISKVLGTNQVNISRSESKILKKLNKSLVA